MSYASKSVVDNMIQLVDEGWEPKFEEIQDKYYSNKDRREPLDTARQEKLTRLLISRVRRTFKKEDSPRFFYEVGGVYKLLSTSGDSLDVVKGLVNLTNGFQKASLGLINDTAQKYPQLTSKFLYKLQAAFEQIDLLANVGIQSLKEGLEEHEDRNK